MRFAVRNQVFPSAIFAELMDKKRYIHAQNRDIIDRSVGGYNHTTAPHVIGVPARDAAHLEGYAYAIIDLPKLKQDTAGRYQRQCDIARVLPEPIQQKAVQRILESGMLES